MIQQLITAIETLLKEGFEETIIPENNIGAGPLTTAGNQPHIGIFAGTLDISDIAQDSQSSDPRPQSIREELSVNNTAPLGPYALSQSPLPGSVTCKVIFNQGELNERSRLLQDKKDFNVGLATSNLEFITDITGASDIILKYDFVGVFNLREFNQELLIDMVANGPAQQNQLSALCISMLLTNLSELIRGHNFGNQNTESSNQYLLVSTINNIKWVGGGYHPINNDQKWQLRFQVKGQVKAIKSISGGFGLIERVHSPGKVSIYPVDIDIGLE